MLVNTDLDLAGCAKILLEYMHVYVHMDHEGVRLCQCQYSVSSL